MEQPKSPTERGIYVSAFLVKQLLIERDDVMSAVRFVDIFTVDVPAPQPNTVVFIPPVEAELAILIKAERREEMLVAVFVCYPSGRRNGPHEFRVVVEGGVAGHMLNIHLKLNANEPGDYWIDVLIDGQLATRLPARVVMQVKANIPESSNQPPQE